MITLLTILFNLLTPPNDSVDLQVSLERSKIPAGSHTYILFQLTPVEGVHLTAEPPVEFKIDSGTVAKTVGKPRGVKDGDNLSPADPVRQEIVIAPKAPDGKYTIKGTLTYYYCSDAEGTCMRYRQPVTLTLNVGR